MPAPKNQRHITWQEAVEQGRRNRRQAVMLESRNEPFLDESAAGTMKLSGRGETIDFIIGRI